MDVIVILVAKVLTVMFFVGMAGCVIVIPFAAYSMFSVLFSTDLPHEKIGHPKLKTLPIAFTKRP